MRRPFASASFWITLDYDYDIRFMDKEVPEYISIVNYAGVHPWETRTVVLITNNAWFFPDIM